MKNIYLALFCGLIANFVFAQNQQLTNLPTMRINTENLVAVNSKTVYVNATLSVVSSDPAQEVANRPVQIRGRGNSTWNFAKKPYRLKFESKMHLCDLPANAKKWVLLANHADKSLIRNALAFKIGEIVEMEWTPSTLFVDLYLNNDYKGNYMLTDQIDVRGSRVNIEEQDSATIASGNISGGYLLEIDGFADGEPQWFTSNQGLKITIKYPDSEEILPQQVSYIRNYINTFESKLFASNYTDPVLGYRSMVDTVSLINWYIASELTGNPDCFWSTYIYKRKDDNKLYFGPLWDYDIAFNNDYRLGNAAQKLMRNDAFNPRAWIQRFWSDTWFRQAVAVRWNELVANNLNSTLQNCIDSLTVLLNASQTRNFTRWNVLSTQVYHEQYLFSTYAQYIQFLKSYITNRIAFLTADFVTYTPPEPTPNFVAENFYYLITNVRTNNAIDVTDNSTQPDAQLYLWAPSDDDDGQLWQIEAIDAAYFRFINKNSGLIMTANGRGTNLLQKPLNTSDAAQKWKIVPVGTGGVYGIESAVAPDYFAVNNNGGSFANGNPVIVYINNISGSQNQQWYIQKRDMIPTALTAQKQIPFSFFAKNNLLTVRNLPENSVLRVFNLQGIPVVQTTQSGNNVSVPLPYAGIYIIHIASGNEIYSVKFRNQ